MCCYSSRVNCLQWLSFMFTLVECLFGGYTFIRKTSFATQLRLLHVLFVDGAARDPKQASDVSVRCTRPFTGSEQEIDCVV